MATKFQKVCDELNKILENRPEDRKEFIDKIDDIIYKKVFNKGGNLYFDRELFIDSNFDTEECRKMIHRTDVMFRDTKDPVEHPGITFCYKSEEV